MKNRIFLGLSVILGMTALPAFAVDPLSAGSLQRYCEGATESVDEPEARLCFTYVNGFLDGAIATDARVAENVVEEIDSDETFTERAIRTRVIRRIEDYGASVYAEFCVGQPVSIIEVVTHVVDEFANYDTLEGLEAQTVVYSALRRHYPCAADAR